MARRTIPVTIELPVEAAELLVQYGPSIIKALSDLVAKARASEVEFEPLEVREQRLQAQRREFLSLGRQVYRGIRRRFRQATGRKFTGKVRLHQEAEFLRQAAKELGHDTYRAQVAYASFRKHLRTRIKARRKREVVRLYLSGHRDNFIASRLGIAPATVARDIREYRERAKARTRTDGEETR